MYSETFQYKFEDFGASPLSLHRSYKAFISPYKIYPEFDDPFEAKPPHYHDRNLFLDFYDFPDNKHLYFPFEKHDKKIKQENQLENLGKDNVPQKEIKDVNKDTIKINKTRKASKKEEDQKDLQLPKRSIMDDFVDLVDQSSSFWIQKFSKIDTKPLFQREECNENHSECESESSNKENIGFSINDSCSFHSDSQHCLENCLDEYEGSHRSELSDVKFSKEEKVKKRIRKIPKKITRKWTRKDDQKLLKLSKDLEYDWEKVKECFENSSVSSIFIQKRYKQLKTRAEDKLNDLKKDMIFQPNHYFHNEFQNLFSDPFNDQIKLNLIEVKNEDYEVLKSEEQQPKETGYLEKKVDEEVFDSFFLKEENLSERLINFENDFFSYKKVEEDHHQGTSPIKNQGAFKVEEDIYEERNLEGKSTKDAIDILNSRISLLTSLYNQTKIELNKLQREIHR